MAIRRERYANSDDYLCVFANENNPEVFMGFIDYNYKSKTDCHSVTIEDKTRNDIQRKKEGLPHDCPLDELHKWCLLTSDDPEFMMKKVEYCYEHNLREISNKPYKGKDNRNIERD